MRVETPTLALDTPVANLTVVVLDNFACVDAVDADIRVSVHVVLVLNKIKACFWLSTENK